LSNGGLISGAFAEQSAHTGGIDLSAKGDMHGYSNDDARIPISTNNFSLLCDSAQSLGLKWAASPTSLLSAAGDNRYASGANTLAKLAKGDNDKVLTLKSGIPSWESAAGGGAWAFLQGHTFDGSETDHTFTTDYNVADYSEFHIVYHGYGGTSMNIEWDEKTDKYYGVNNWIYSGGETQTVTSDSSSVAIGVALSASYQNHFDIYISAREKTSATCYGTTDTGQNIQTASAGRQLDNNTSGIIREIKLTFGGAPADTCEVQMYGLSNS